MAMTLRLPEELDKQLEEIARERHTSKHAIVVEAASRFVDHETKTARVIRLADDVIDQYSDAIQRLADA